MLSDDLIKTLKTKYDVVFQDRAHLDLALTHASRNRDINNERLEFLGDRVLSLVLADAIFEAYPTEAEGPLALRHAALVRASMLAQVARDLGLSDALDVSDHDRSSGTAALDNVLADGLEALIGALWCDQGLDACHRLIRGLWKEPLATMTEPPQDPKTALQEWAQARGLPLPRYDMVARTGPDHAPTFTIEVTVEKFGSARAEGASRRVAEKLAATELLERTKA
jgi:ribonuclease III